MSNVDLHRPLESETSCAETAIIIAASLFSLKGSPLGLSQGRAAADRATFIIPSYAPRVTQYSDESTEQATEALQPEKTSPTPGVVTPSLAL